MPNLAQLRLRIECKPIVGSLVWAVLLPPGPACAEPEMGRVFVDAPATTL